MTKEHSKEGARLCPEEFVICDLFDRWEQVWHEGRYNLVAGCVALAYTRHDESGTRRVTPDEYAAELAAAHRERPDAPHYCLPINSSMATMRGSVSR